MVELFVPAFVLLVPIVVKEVENVERFDASVVKFAERLERYPNIAVLFADAFVLLVPKAVKLVASVLRYVLKVVR